ncbi:MAG TPA: hypothetical protein VHU80_19645 [Polyangiaceae bacterium]|jgi:hypothetical protein|nr:hypothetical protein [Polyangiaceae bacterium]
MTRSSRDAAVSVFFYLAVTVGVPFARNGYRTSHFVVHALTVVLIAAIAWGLRTAFVAVRPTSEDT